MELVEPETHFEIRYVGKDDNGEFLYEVWMPADSGCYKVSGPATLKECCDWIATVEDPESYTEKG